MATGEAGQAIQREASPQLTAQQAEAEIRWLQLVGQVRTNKALKQRLIDTPIAVLQEHGIKVRDGLDVRVVEDTDTVHYLTIPAESQLTNKDLDAIVGGSPVTVAIKAAVTVVTGAASLLLNGADASVSTANALHNLPGFPGNP